MASLPGAAAVARKHAHMRRVGSASPRSRQQQQQQQLFRVLFALCGLGAISLALQPLTGWRWANPSVPEFLRQLARAHEQQLRADAAAAAATATEAAAAAEAAAAQGYLKPLRGEDVSFPAGDSGALSHARSGTAKMSAGSRALRATDPLMAARDLPGSEAFPGELRGLPRAAAAAVGGRDNAHQHQHALHRELHWSLFPLQRGLVGSRGGWVGRAAGGGRAKDEQWQEELVRKIERWSSRPSSLCFGHGNFTIVTVTAGLPHDYAVHMRRNRLHYCSLVHDCRYCDFPISLDSARPISWTKVKAMQLVLSFSERVVLMDADALIVNASVSFLTLAASLGDGYNATEKDVIYTTGFQAPRDAEPTQLSSINTGVYIMRSSSWSKAFLEVLYRTYEYSLFHRITEQDAVMIYRSKYRADFLEHAAVIPYRYMNVPCSQQRNEYNQGDFIAHYAGGDRLQKYEKLSRMFQDAK